ncbi:MAG: histone deacetylase [Bacteroidota bacterium]
MKTLYHPDVLLHDTGDHAETSKRLQTFAHLPTTEVTLDEAHLALVHEPDYIATIKELCTQGGGRWDVDTVTSPDSFSAALTAVELTILASESQNFALVRPPGHHAYAKYGSGFCLFNSIAIAVQILVNQGKRVAILDFDGHFGDGTSHIFYETDQVLFCSLHQHPAFPDDKGPAENIGSGKGKGYNLNIPLPPECGDDLFMHAIHSVLPALKQFDADVVAISAGFDAHQNDPLLQLNVTNHSYHAIGKLLRSTFDNVFATLEGGYNLQVLPKAIKSFIAGINDESFQPEEEKTYSPRYVRLEYEERMEVTMALFQEYWDVKMLKMPL